MPRCSDVARLLNEKKARCSSNIGSIRTLAEGGLAEPDEPAVTLGSVSEPLLDSRHLREVELELLCAWPGLDRLLVMAPFPVSAWLSQSSTPVQFYVGATRFGRQPNGWSWACTAPRLSRRSRRTRWQPRALRGWDSSVARDHRPRSGIYRARVANENRIDDRIGEREDTTARTRSKLGGLVWLQREDLRHAKQANSGRAAVVGRLGDTLGSRSTNASGRRRPFEMSHP
jgi:hypothetical protein